MRLSWLLLNTALSFVVATDSQSSTIADRDVRLTVNQIMKYIEKEIQNRTSQDKLAKRMYGGHLNIMYQYYPKAYDIVRAGCTPNNPKLYRPAPGGGWFPPHHYGVYKREEAIDHEVDGHSENAKIIQKELAAEWKTLTEENNSLVRRAPMQLKSSLRPVTRPPRRVTFAVDPLKGTKDAKDGLGKNLNINRNRPRVPIQWGSIFGVIVFLVGASLFVWWLIRSLFIHRQYIPSLPPTSPPPGPITMPPTPPIIPQVSAPLQAPIVPVAPTYVAPWDVDPDAFVYYG